VYVATGKRVAIFDVSGREIDERVGIDPVRCVAAGNNGTVYAGFRDRIEVFPPKASKPSATWEGLSDRTWFTGLVLTGENLFAADAGNRCVLRYDRSGKITGRLGVKDKEKNVAGLIVPSPYLKVQVAPDGLLRINNPGRHRVEVHTPEGDLEQFWGKAGAGIECFCGCCNPVGIAVLPDGRHVTAEKGLPRVKVYTSTGEFESVVAGPDCFVENARAGAGRDVSDGLLGGLDVATDRMGRILILDLVTSRVHMMAANA
jgi:hypothetical protein